MKAVKQYNGKAVLDLTLSNDHCSS